MRYNNHHKKEYKIMITIIAISDDLYSSINAGIAQLASMSSYRTRIPWLKTSCGYGQGPLLQFITFKGTLIVLVFLFLE